MKQKMVIAVDMKGDESRSKALQIAVGLHVVTSVSLGDKDKGQLEVVGEGVDRVKLTSSLRKKLTRSEYFPCLPLQHEAYAQLISVNEVKEEKKEEKKEETKYVWQHPAPQYFYPEVIREHDPFPCSIL